MSIISYFPNNAEQPTQLARLVLAKFSYTTTSTLHNAPLNWNHIIGQNDIEAVFERYHASGPGAGQGLGKTVLKVSQHAKVLVSCVFEAVRRHNTTARKLIIDNKRKS